MMQQLPKPIAALFISVTGSLIIDEVFFYSKMQAALLNYYDIFRFCF